MSRSHSPLRLLTVVREMEWGGSGPVVNGPVVNEMKGGGTIGIFLIYFGGLF